MSAKSEAINAISKLSEEATMEEIMYRLHVLDKVRKGEDDVLAGRIVTTEELRAEIEEW
jgi:predicted transcriptional regulator